MAVLFTIPGSPVAKGRPRVGKFGAYTPKKTVEYENLVRMAYVQCAPDKPPIDGYIRAEILLYFPIPKSTTKKAKAGMEAGTIRPAKKPDCDNCIKSITDALNGIAYKDDSQIVEITCQKYYSSQPRAVVLLSELEEKQLESNSIYHT